MKQTKLLAADVELLQNLPGVAHDERRTHLAKLLTGDSSDDPACIWLDRNTKRCRYHEQRPSICREFEIGSEDCHAWRHQHQQTGDAEACLEFRLNN